MLYITRMDHGNSHGYWVRIRQNKPDGRQKFFSDNSYRGKYQALEAAKQWRDIRTEETADVIAKTRRWGCGSSECWKEYNNGWSYLSIVAKYWVPEVSKQVFKSFSATKYGYEKAVANAEQWLRMKRNGLL